MIGIYMLLILAIGLVMKFGKGKLKIIFTSIIAICCVYCTILNIDMNRFKTLRKPIFAIKTGYIGSMIRYDGLGYTIGLEKNYQNVYSAGQLTFLKCYTIYVPKKTNLNNKNNMVEFIDIINDDNKIVNSNNTVSLNVDETSITKKGAKFIISNNSNEEYTYGADYRIDINENGNWKEAPLYAQLAWNEIAYILKAKNESSEINIDWTVGYGELKEGKYRLVKKVFKNSDVPITDENIIEIYAEFDIK